MHSDLPLKLNVLIVGAGITGLTTAIACVEKGFDVTALEYTAQFSHVGAGLMISSNASRILVDIGLRKPLDACGIHMRRTVFKKWDDGAVLSETTYLDAEEKLGAPLWQVHRADLHDALLAKAKSVGVNIRMGARVKKFNPEEPSVLLDDGEVVRADIVVASDGYRSRARSEMLGCQDDPRPSGNSAYRALIPGAVMKSDPEMAEFMDMENQTTFSWVGDGAHILGYPIRQGEFYNVVSTQTARKATGAQYVVPVDSSEFMERFQSWDPKLVGILKKLPKDGVLEWKLCDLEPMKSWLFPGAKIVLIGDASHAMLPSSAQGAGMGIEDGAAIAELLARAESKSQIPAVLKTFQNLRLPRTTFVADSGRRNAKKWHEKDAKGGTVTDDMWNYDVKNEAREIPIEGI
ncbi:hypothetical protein DL95DRAFT_373775 [Leptodontidium sp. 2 PMI_412]|nr:hypothetical protein DL95DRAFT_373775 [Leptodontidium sp. 2 PMI_412]